MRTAIDQVDATTRPRRFHRSVRQRVRRIPGPQRQFLQLPRDPAVQLGGPAGEQVQLLDLPRQEGLQRLGRTDRPWFGQPGRGTQYQLKNDLVLGAPQQLNVLWLIQQGYLERVPATRPAKLH